MRKKIASLRLLSLLALVLTISLAACKKDPCETEICQPCPSSRLVMNYVDSTGQCIPAFHASARVVAIDNETSDTLYTYGFSDSCQVGFLVDEKVTYHLWGSNPAVHDVISIETMEYQEPINVTECCLCYPVSKVQGKFNGQDLQVDFIGGQYTNEPFIRSLN